MLLRYQEDEENRLIVSAAQGDSSAFDQLVSRYSPHVFRVALAILGNREDAVDIQQEAFLKAYRKISTFRGESSFKTWIHAITTRLCLMHRRSAVSEYGKLQETNLLQINNTVIPPDSIATAIESAEHVRRVLGKMPPNDRLLVVLKYVEQLNHKEIAEVLGCSVESSRSRLLRAKKMFRDLYGEVR